ncbi:pyrroloquinoline quinone biosynthesis protein D [Actinocorallia herbida]|uniref:Pyrroloquinoline quinone biosynthesis protein D n=1 Tax=Actinocorallia herbida TaxID=58109 RepID=A0A3N1D0Y5_9ACTN|nr:pyrroloquinoline quinone biosynthesis peptide chaperone PqqD [Actinocorallia herbida]ROO87170.1 pyrroloquinoline quinone biosynthesis protein D [Actinocorallia herbida]
MLADHRPALARSVRLHHDKVRDTDLLLMPERAVRLTGAGGTILRLCDGRRTTAEIVAELVRDFPGEPVEAETTAFLDRMREQGWLI